MYDDPLYVEIMRDTVSGDVLTVQGTIERWGRVPGHAARVLDWMAAGQPQPTMKKLPNTIPQKWQRV